MNHAEIVKLKKDYVALKRELNYLRDMDRILEAEMAKAETNAKKFTLEEKLIRTRANIGACLRRQEELEERVRGAWA